MGPCLCPCHPKSDSWEHCGPVPLFPHHTGLVLSLPAQLCTSRPALAAATDVLLLCDSGSAVGGLASYWSRKLGEIKCSTVFSLLLFISAHPHDAYGASWCKASPTHSWPRGCKSLGERGAVSDYNWQTYAAWREDIVYLFNLQLGGGRKWAKGLPEVPRGRQGCLIK